MKYRILYEENGEFVDTGQTFDTGERLHAKAHEKAQAVCDELHAQGGCWAVEAIKESKRKPAKKSAKKRK